MSTLFKDAYLTWSSLHESKLTMVLQIGAAGTVFFHDKQ
jgi:hypothetical protein